MTTTMENEKTIGITGASGYLGRNLIPMFLSSGIKVVAFSRNNLKFQFSSPNLKYVNVESYINLPKINCDYIIHFAEDSHNNNKIENIRDIESKIENLKAIIRNTKAKIIYASSGLVYNNLNLLAKSESDLINIDNHYKKIKIENENFVLKNNGLVLRLSSVIGEYPAKNTLIYDIRNLVINELPLILKNTNVIRDFLSIRDLFNFIIKLVELNLYGIFNVSYGKGTKLLKLCELIQEKYNKPLAKFTSLKKSNFTDFLVLDNRKIKKETKYSPKDDISTIIKNLK